MHNQKMRRGLFHNSSILSSTSSLVNYKVCILRYFKRTQDLILEYKGDSNIFDYSSSFMHESWAHDLHSSNKGGIVVAIKGFWYILITSIQSTL
jgi:hypothetical protein